MPVGFFARAAFERFLQSARGDAAELAQGNILDLAVSQGLGLDHRNLDARAGDGQVEWRLVAALDRQDHFGVRGPRIKAIASFRSSW